MKSFERDRRRGMALLVVVVLTMLIALGAYRFSFYMESQYRLTRLYEEQTQARLAAISGVELAASLVELPLAERANLGGLLDNPAVLRHIAVDGNTGLSSRNAEANDTWRCGLVAAPLSGSDDNSLATAANVDEAAPLRFGFENESAKLHLPTLLEWDRKLPGHARATLLGLPGATEGLVEEWLRGLGHSTRSGDGSPSSLSERLNAAKNPIRQQSETELMRWMWFGGDLNQNFRLDPLEALLADQLSNERTSGAQRQATTKGSNAGATEPPAWQRYVTWHSGQRNQTRMGQPRIFLNESNLQSLHQKLAAVWPADWANFVIAIRQFGPQPNSPAKPGGAVPLAASFSPDFSKPASYSFKSVLDLVGADVQVPVVAPTPAGEAPSNPNRNAKQTLRNPFSSDLSEVRNYLGRILDEATTDISAFTTGGVDATAAPAEVLAGVPGIDSALAQRMVQQRSSAAATSSPEARDTLVWLLDDGLLDLAKLKEIEPYLTCRSDVYSVQSVGYRDSQSPVYRCTVTIDARQIPARILNQQIWHPWDRGFSMAQLHSTTP